MEKSIARTGQEACVWEEGEEDDAILNRMVREDPTEKVTFEQ